MLLQKCKHFAQSHPTREKEIYKIRRFILLFRSSIIAHFGSDTDFNKYKGKWVRKVGGMWIPLVYIDFIIECERNELVECET